MVKILRRPPFWMGPIPMAKIMVAIVEEQRKRQMSGEGDVGIPISHDPWPCFVDDKKGRTSLPLDILIWEGLLVWQSSMAWKKDKGKMP